MTRLVVLLVLLVACPGTPPGNFVRDASSGEIVKSGAALCALGAARQGGDVAIATATVPAPPPVATCVAAPIAAPPAPRASPGPVRAQGARGPPRAAAG